MFKSISLKISAMFVLLTISVIILIGTFMTDTTDRYYHDEFIKINSFVFTEDYVSSLSKNIGMEDDVQKIYSSISAYFGQLGIDSFKNCYILDGQTGKTVCDYASNPKLADTLEISPNIISAMNGNVASEVSMTYNFMDYAVPLISNGKVAYIVYIRDSMEESNSILRNIFSIIIQALLLGIGISLIFSVLLSVSIISPIKSLTQKSNKIASGDFEYSIDVKSPDEIGQLTETFNYMGQELKNTLNAIQSEKDKVETILQYMTDGVIAFDVNGNVIHINPAAKSLLAIENAESATFRDFFEYTEYNFEQVLYINHLEGVERILERNSKQISAYFAPFKAKDKSAGVIVVLRDITEQEKLDKSRREFVANVSHELRTPLTTVKSYTETLSDLISDDSYDPQMFTNFLNVINAESDRMTRLVRDLLLLSSLDHSMKDMQKEKIDIGMITSEIVNKLQMTAKDKHQILVFEYINELPDIKGNADRLEQVITNVITNALKYTPEGGTITVSAMHIFESVTIKVKDNGIGIPEKDIEHIFERFYRVDKARSREMGGTGLGLAIAKEIVEAHGGDITVKSVVSQGTEVMIKLPV